MQEQKKDTICRKMTPLGLRETNDQKKLEIIFSESPRFFTQQFSDLQMAADTRKKWNVWIRDKVKVTIYFTEEPGNTALIHKIGK